MAISFGANIAALRATTQLNRADSAASSSLERLSSGLRINKVSDDAAGVAIASRLNADSSLFRVAARNIDAADSLLAVADGAIGEMQSIVGRLSELATQAANGAYTAAQRSAMQSEADALSAEYNRIIDSTQFNSQRLFNESPTTLSVQVGPNAADAISVSFGTHMLSSMSAVVGSGVFSTPVHFPASDDGEVHATDLNGDGRAEILQFVENLGVQVYVANSDGTYSVQTLPNGVPNGGMTLGDFNSDGKIDIGTHQNLNTHFFAGNGDGSFIAPLSAVFSIPNVVSYTQSADFNGDSKLDLFALTITNQIVVELGNGNGTFKAGKFQASGISNAFQKPVLGDFNGDGKMDFIEVDSGGTNSIGRFFAGNGDGSFLVGVSFDTGTFQFIGPPQAADLDGDSDLDIVQSVTGPGIGGLAVLLNNGNGTFSAMSFVRTQELIREYVVGDFNEDGETDVAVTQLFNGRTYVLTGNGNGTFKAPTTYSISGEITNTSSTEPAQAADLDGDGTLDFIFGVTHFASNGFYLSTQGTTIGTTVSLVISDIALDTVENAQLALDSLAALSGGLSAERGAIGAHQSRLAVARANALSQAELHGAAADRITSLDVAEEVALLVAAQIRSQAAAAIFAQANQQPQIALTLLAQRD